MKIHEGPGEPAPETRNEPHVCTFHVHGMFFDAGQELTFTVTSWPPTGDRSVVLSGTITADGTGEGRTPGEYELADGHYRLTVDTGNGKPTQDKHKMFWVQCAPPTTPPGPPCCGGGGGGGDDSGDGDLYSAPAPTVSPTTPPAVLGEQTVPPANLAQTGSSALLPNGGSGSVS